ncbi:terpene cyclase/mutase family protein [Kiritimatiellaeota bacterium B1221]|nr:terpene cyclase/mutase family protein [Kiritimatiellaeota bacterium B1221]
MNVQKYLKYAHTSSVLVSVIINALLVLALVTFITFSEGMEPDVSKVMVIDPATQEDIEDLEEEFEPEEVVDPDELNELTDFTLDTPMETDFEQQTEEVADVTNTDVSSLSDLMSDVSSPVVMTGLLVGRTPKARQAAAAKYGKGLEKFSEPAVMKALEWLRDNQRPNGGWSKNGAGDRNVNTGYTGLALLAFLAHGETPASADFGPTVAKGIRFLVEHQDSKGLFQPVGGNTGYGHAMATYAMAEAYTMTDNILLKEPLQRGVNVIIKGQMPNGGYDYHYKRETRNDLSISSWQLQALKAAYISKGTGPDTKKYLDSAMDGMLLGSKDVDGKGRYFTYSMTSDKVGGAQKTVSAAGTLALHLAGRGKSKEAKQALEYLSQYTEKDRLPSWGNDKIHSGHGGEIYYWYYAVQAFFQEDPDGSNFKRFMPSLVKALVQNQADDGHWLCYSEGGKKMGKTLNTALGALGLMVYYRYLPTTQADNIQQVDVAEPTYEEDEEDVGFDI